LIVANREAATMSVWEAITLTLVASACMNVGLVLQKKGLVEALGAPGQRSVRRRFRASPTWYLGLTLLIGGYAIYALAVSARSAPISLLQPLSASGLLVVAGLAVVYLDERFDALEWLGVGLLLAGVILLGFSVDPDTHWAVTVKVPQYIVFVCVTATIVLILHFILRRTTTPGRDEFLFGLLTGILLGTGYLNTRIVSLARGEGRIGLMLLAAVCMVIGLGGGLTVLQMAFRRGRALIVTAVNLVTNQVLVVTGGLVCLGERFPREPMPLAARIGGLGAILIGTVLLSRLSAGGNNRVRTAPFTPVEANPR
jgi:drug/metabolite transporter (DMT)-like permease